MTPKPSHSSIALLLLASCLSRESVFVEKPPIDDLGSALFLAVSEDGAAFTFDIDPAQDIVQIQIPNGTFSLFVFGFECASLTELGFVRQDRGWRIPQGVLVRRPDLMMQLTDSAWSELDRLPADVETKLGSAFVDTTPCFNLQMEAIEWEGEKAIHLGTTAAGTTVAVPALFRLDLFREDGSIDRVALSTSTPSKAVFFSTANEIWMYGDGGELWHAALPGLFDGTASWVQEPDNPFWTAGCEDQDYRLTGGPVDDPTQLLTISRRGGIFLFDVPTKSWTEIIPDDAARGGCSQRRVDVLWLGPDRFIAARSDAGELVRYEGPGRITRMPVRSSDLSVGGPQVLADAPGLGLVVGTDTHSILRVPETGELELLADVPVLFELFDIRSIVSVGYGRIMWTGDGGARVYDRDFGLCETVADEGLPLNTAIRSKERLMAYAGIAEARTLWWVAPEEPSVCAPSPR